MTKPETTQWTTLVAANLLFSSGQRGGREGGCRKNAAGGWKWVCVTHTAESPSFKIINNEPAIPRLFIVVGVWPFSPFRVRVPCNANTMAAGSATSQPFASLVINKSVMRFSSLQNALQLTRATGAPALFYLRPTRCQRSIATPCRRQRTDPAAGLSAGPFDTPIGRH